MGMLDGQVALITGCARVKGFGREGADLAVTDVAPEGTRNVGERGEEELVGWRGLESLAAELEQLGRGDPTLRRNRIRENGYQAIWVHEEGGGTFEDNDLRGNERGAW